MSQGVIARKLEVQRAYISGIKNGKRNPTLATIQRLAEALGVSAKERKNCIIIHGCPSDAEKAMNPETRTYDKHWIPWLKKNLLTAGIITETPLMPDPWVPSYQKFKTEFERYEVGENTILVGHSCGSAFLVRWLGETKRKIFKLILVAPWKIPDKDDEFRKEFYTYPDRRGYKIAR